MGCNRSITNDSSVQSSDTRTNTISELTPGNGVTISNDTTVQGDLEVDGSVHFQCR